MPDTIRNVACTVCGCVCDDLAVTTDAGRVVRADGACHLAEPWFLRQNTAPAPAARIDGRPAELEAAYARAAELLRSARSPLIFGLSRSTTEGQRAAVALADRIGATVDTTASTGHAPSIMALQQVGESTCTLGEVKARADLVVFWGSDPVTTHPRHLERYSLDPPGRFVPGGREDRYLVVADEEETETAKLADLFVRVPPGRHWETLWTLRMLVKGLPPQDPTPRPPPLRGEGEKEDAGPASSPLPSQGRGLGGGVLPDLAARMTGCRCGVIFFGAGVTRGRLAHRTVEALLQLVADLNDHTRFYARRMRRYGDVAGADAVLTWQTGYPFGVNLARGYPRYNPAEFTGPEMLGRGEVDVCVLVGSDTAADLPDAALDHLRRIPVIALDPPEAEPVVPAAVAFATAVYGVHRPGTAYRMDEVPVPLRVILPTDHPSDGEVLGELLRRVLSGRLCRPYNTRPTGGATPTTSRTAASDSPTSRQNHTAQHAHAAAGAPAAASRAGRQSPASPSRTNTHRPTAAPSAKNPRNPAANTTPVADRATVPSTADPPGAGPTRPAATTYVRRRS
ncbi:MAG: formylmethanofuran dehydrogenase subunit B [Gemmataceae bacterium]|nr:formylmethanofuran dehydrogenase subunit B [Gemmataceae bacterium]